MEKTRHETKIKFDGEFVRKSSVLARLLPMQIINPDIHKLLEDSPKYRRQFIDWGVFHVEPGFGFLWKTFRRALAQRNAALRDRWTKKATEQWDIELVAAAEDLDEARIAYLKSLKVFIDRKITGFEDLPEVDISYQRGWREGVSYLDYLRAQYDSDRDRGFTQFGPHRADMRLRIDGHEARDILSRGQQKLLVAILVLAQCQQLASRDLSTVILVDDLPAELDADKRRALLGALEKTGAQIFVTGTESALFEDADFTHAGMFHVEHGRITTGT
jgi:DNA replication and repair protein RecF